MKRNIVAILVLLSVVGGLVVFAHNRESRGLEIHEELCDTLSLEPKPRVEPLKMLPDTLFESVGALEYVVEVLDTVTSPLVMPLESHYDTAPGVFTFRGSAQRDMPQSGVLQAPPTKIEQEWVFVTDYDGRQTKYGVWGGGSGWTGQPLYVEWSDSLMALQRRRSKALTENFSSCEIIVGSLSSYVYFLDFETGKASRSAYYTGNPIKGTLSLDPRLNGNLYIGQGIPNQTPFGAEVFNIFDHKSISFYDRDPKAWRGWGAYDSSPLIAGNFLIRASENGTLYKLVADESGVKLHSRLRYRVKGKGAPGMEASPAVWRNYCYTLDNHGNLLCVNLNNMQPVWYFSNVDDSDASPVLQIEDGKPYLYVGSALDKQGEGGCCHLTKVDGLSGEKVWQQRIAVRKIEYAGALREGGMFSTPLVGRGDCEGLIFTNICGMGDKDRGTFVAIDRLSGEIKYKRALQYYSWSSPVALYTAQGEMFVFTGDVFGNAYLIKASSGEILFSKKMAANFESSPVVVDNCVVVGSRGREIYKFKIL